MGVVTLHNVKYLLAVISVFLPISVMAHTVGAVPENTLEPWALISLAMALVLYLLGLINVKSKKPLAGSLLRQVVCFISGWIILAVALLSPIDTLGSRLFSAHMVQHELMMIAAAPLLVLGRPFGLWLWAIPEFWRYSIVAAAQYSALRKTWIFLCHPLTAWTLHAAAIWLWHIPAFFQAALQNNTIHEWQHLSFLVTALFFWWAILGAHGRGLALASLFTTMLHTGALGVLLTFSAMPWYTAYGDMPSAYGLSPLEDQQLGGLIMWIPGGLIYLIAALGLMARHFYRKASSSSY